MFFTIIQFERKKTFNDCIAYCSRLYLTCKHLEKRRDRQSEREIERESSIFIRYCMGDKFHKSYWSVEWLTIKINFWSIEWSPRIHNIINLSWYIIFAQSNDNNMNCFQCCWPNLIVYCCYCIQKKLYLFYLVSIQCVFHSILSHKWAENTHMTRIQLQTDDIQIKFKYPLICTHTFPNIRTKTMNFLHLEIFFWIWMYVCPCV